MTRAAKETSMNTKTLENERRQVKRSITKQEWLSKKPQLSTGTQLVNAFIENRRLHILEREIVFFMARFIQQATPLRILLDDLEGHAWAEELGKLYGLAFESKRHHRQRALAVVFRMYGISVAMTAKFLDISSRTVEKYHQRFRTSGLAGLLPHRRNGLKVQDEKYKRAIFQILHAPPSDYGFNRTTWRRKDIHAVMAKNSMPIGKNYIDKIIKNAGYRFLKARRVLTSNDPDYRTKVDRIKKILRNLKRTERFFSIDEFGPFAVKQHGGRRLVGPGVYPTVPQFQYSKGCLIVTAALELSTNQITHFYSTGKNTLEMTRLLDFLLDQYHDCSKLYLSWDAASWHASKRFMKRLADVNRPEFRRENMSPVVVVAPLPARAQFLNVIESVFSGLAVSVVHNSDYQSLDEARRAIDRYFQDRNAYFRENPKRAGKKIWGGERVAGIFDESHNCKNARFR
jgi:transposase